VQACCGEFRRWSGGGEMNSLMNKTPFDQTAEHLSALVDGELAHHEVTQVLAVLGEGDAAFDRWDCYHLIGEVLRSPALPLAGASADMRLVGRLRDALAHEPGPLQNLHVAVPEVPRPVGQAASNDDSFRWKVAAGFASLAAVSALAWNSFYTVLPPAAPTLAAVLAPQQVVVASPQGPVVRDARLQELMAAHRQLGGASALQEPSGFLRNTTFELPEASGR
jgi:sigma-E factor negative regulatory protein RseA